MIPGLQEFDNLRGSSCMGKTMVVDIVVNISPQEETDGCNSDTLSPNRFRCRRICGP